MTRYCIEVARLWPNVVQNDELRIRNTKRSEVPLLFIRHFRTIPSLVQFASCGTPRSEQRIDGITGDPSYGIETVYILIVLRLHFRYLIKAILTSSSVPRTNSGLKTEYSVDVA